jgi:hypothetical protein
VQGVEAEPVGSVPADIGCRPPAAMNECPLTAIRPLSVISERTFAGAAYRLLCHAPGGADDRFAAVVIRSSRRLTG